MKIAFARINNTIYPFRLDLENIVFEGNLVKVNPKLVKINAIMQGFLYKSCDSCGQEFELKIKENLELFVSNGMFKDGVNELSNTIEFFDGQIDLIEVAINELEVYLSDYFYCKKCKN